MNRLKTYLSKTIAVVMIGIICAAAVSINATAAGATKISDRGIAMIKAFEGCSLTAYKPVSTEKYYTIGYGHYGPDVKKDMKITQAQAEKLLRDDLPEYEGYVNKFAQKTGRKFTQNEFDVMVSFTYQNGPGWSLNTNYSIYKYLSKSVKYSESDLYQTFMYWTTGDLPGLVKRRRVECAIFLLSDSTPYEVWEVKPNVYFRESYSTSSKSYGLFGSSVPVDYSKLVVVTEKKNNQGYTWGKTRYYTGNKDSGSAKTGWFALNYANKRFGSLTAPTTTTTTKKPTTTTKKTTATTLKPTTTTQKPTLDHDPIYPFEQNEKLGDANDDGKVTAADVLLIRKYIAGQILDDYEIVNSDTARSGEQGEETTSTLTESSSDNSATTDISTVQSSSQSGVSETIEKTQPTVTDASKTETQSANETSSTADQSGSQSGSDVTQTSEMVQTGAENEPTSATNTAKTVKDKVLYINRIDINNDKKATAADVLMIRKHIAGVRVFY